MILSQFGGGDVHCTDVGAEGMCSDYCGIKNLIKSLDPSLKEQKQDCVQDCWCQWRRAGCTLDYASGKMNTVTPSTGLKHAQFLVNLYSSYMGHDWAHHGWLFFLKMKEKNHNRKFFFVLLCTFFTGGLPADGITAMVVKECRLLSIALGCLWRLLVAEDACTSRSGDRG